VQIEVAAARRGKDQGCARICWCSLEGGERDRLERNGPDAPLRLGALEPTLGEGPTDVADPLVEVNVAAFERVWGAEIRFSCRETVFVDQSAESISSLDAA
jgi:hypothetical protein